MFYPSLKEAKKLAAGFSVIPIAMELMADLKTSIQILRSLEHSGENCFLLESVTNADNWSRYSFLGFRPTVSIRGSKGILTSTKQGTSTSEIADPVSTLRSTLSAHRSPTVAGLPPFTGGFVGYFSYDFLAYTQPAPTLQAKNAEGFEDFHLMLVDKVIAFDHFRQKIVLIVNVSTEDLEQKYAEGIARLKDMERLVLSTAEAPTKPARCGAFSAQFSKEEFSGNVEILKQHIREGDIFQAVLSNRFSADFQGSLLETYRMLRTTSPSPYMVYMHLDDLEIACASPETLVSLRGNALKAFPLAGTRPRSSDDAVNAARAQELLHDEKELSEHDMLVDLARNDLGKISRFGTVEVERRHEIKHYSHVMHLASAVSGELRPELDALDAITATLPAGTLSGAPKKRACELIDRLENQKRGPYGGAMGYIDFSGNADFCIGIRMALRKGDRVFVQAGAGIVADSDPAREYEEIQHKARGVMDALRGEERQYAYTD